MTGRKATGVGVAIGISKKDAEMCEKADRVRVGVGRAEGNGRTVGNGRAGWAVRMRGDLRSDGLPEGLRGDLSFLGEL